jgi:Tol biopolymer transport system component
MKRTNRSYMEMRMPAYLLIGLMGCGVVILPDSDELPNTGADSGVEPRPDGDINDICEELIAFQSGRFGTYEIFVMRPDGSGTKRLTHNTASDYGASWSPDGASLMFTSSRDGNEEIYVMSADGVGQTNLSRTNDVGEETPRWSANGQNIVYVRADVNGPYCYAMSADGTDQRELTPCNYQSFPRWSPDGTKLAYTFNSQVYVVNANGSSPTRLTNSPGTARDPRWSPSGDKIVFVKTVDGNTELHVMDADGSNEENLTRSMGTDVSPEWSPDGSKIVFVSNRDGNYEVYVMNANGTASTRLTMSEANDLDPQWSPDGQQIVFRSNRDGDQEIYIMSAIDGTGRMNLTNSPGTDSGASWRRCP